MSQADIMKYLLKCKRPKESKQIARKLKISRGNVTRALSRMKYAKEVKMNKISHRVILWEVEK